MKRKFGLFILVSLVALVIGIRIIRGNPPAIEIEPYKVKGNPEAPTFIVEFSDFACPYCNVIRPKLDAVLKAYPKDLRVIFKHFPLNMHPPAGPAAEAAECAADQGKFWPYHDFLFDNVADWYDATDRAGKFTSYAEKLGLETKQFRACFESGRKKEIVERNRKEGRSVFVAGTPTCLLNGRKVMTKHNPEYLIEQVGKEIEKLKKS